MFDEPAGAPAFRKPMMPTRIVAVRCAPEPRFVLLDRATDLESVLGDVFDRVAGAASLRDQFGRRVLTLESLVRVVVPRRSLELIAAALGHEVNCDPDRFLRRLGASRRYLRQRYRSLGGSRQ